MRIQTHFSSDISVSCWASPRCRTPLAPSWGGDVAQSWFCFPTYPRLLLSRTTVGAEEWRGRSRALLEHPSHSRTGVSQQDLSVREQPAQLLVVVPRTSSFCSDHPRKKKGQPKGLSGVTVDPPCLQGRSNAALERSGSFTGNAPRSTK